MKNKKAKAEKLQDKMKKAVEVMDLEKIVGGTEAYSKSLRSKATAQLAPPT